MGKERKIQKRSLAAAMASVMALSAVPAAQLANIGSMMAFAAAPVQYTYDVQFVVVASAKLDSEYVKFKFKAGSAGVNALDDIKSVTNATKGDDGIYTVKLTNYSETGGIYTYVTNVGVSAIKDYAITIGDIYPVYIDNSAETADKAYSEFVDEGIEIAVFDKNGGEDTNNIIKATIGVKNYDLISEAKKLDSVINEFYGILGVKDAKEFDKLEETYGTIPATNADTSDEDKWETANKDWFKKFGSDVEKANVAKEIYNFLKAKIKADEGEIDNSETDPTVVLSTTGAAGGTVLAVKDVVGYDDEGVFQIYAKNLCLDTLYGDKTAASNKGGYDTYSSGSSDYKSNEKSLQDTGFDDGLLEQAYALRVKYNIAGVVGALQTAAKRYKPSDMTENYTDASLAKIEATYRAALLCYKSGIGSTVASIDNGVTVEQIVNATNALNNAIDTSEKTYGAQVRDAVKNFVLIKAAIADTGSATDPENKDNAEFYTKATWDAYVKAAAEFDKVKGPAKFITDDELSYDSNGDGTADITGTSSNIGTNIPNLTNAIITKELGKDSKLQQTLNTFIKDVAAMKTAKDNLKNIYQDAYDTMKSLYNGNAKKAYDGGKGKSKYSAATWATFETVYLEAGKFVGAVDGTSSASGNKEVVLGKDVEVHEKSANKCKDGTTAYKKKVIDITKNASTNAYSDERELAKQLCAGLQAAFDELEEVGETTLKTLVDEAKTLKEEDYTASAWTAYKNAVAKGQDILDGKDKTDPDTQISAIKAAKDKLATSLSDTGKLHKAQADLQKVIDTCEAAKLSEADYNADSWKAYSDALAAAKTAVKGTDTAAITAAQTALEKAFNALKAANNKIGDLLDLMKGPDIDDERLDWAEGAIYNLLLTQCSTKAFVVGGATMKNALENVDTVLNLSGTPLTDGDLADMTYEKAKDIINAYDGMMDAMAVAKLTDDGQLFRASLLEWQLLSKKVADTKYYENEKLSDEQKGEITDWVCYGMLNDTNPNTAFGIALSDDYTPGITDCTSGAALAARLDDYKDLIAYFGLLEVESDVTEPDLSKVDSMSAAELNSTVEKEVAYLEKNAANVVQKKALSLLKTALGNDDKKLVLKALAEAKKAHATGDFTGDGKVNFADLALAYAQMQKSSSEANNLYLAACGMSASGSTTVTFADLALIYRGMK